MSESARQSAAWMGATAKAFWGNPVFSNSLNPYPALFAAWGEVTERSFERVAAKPSWGIESVVSKGREYVVTKKVDLDLPFCKLVHFTADRDRPVNRRILLVAPMSGHFATLCRKTVVSLLPNCDVWVTEWRNARDVPVSAGKFDVEDYAKYLVQFFAHLGEDTHVIAVCQPVPLTLVATAMAADDAAVPNPRSLTLIGGPVDPDANPTEVTDFGNRVTMGQLERSVIQTVGFAFPGVGRKVYPGAMQLASFMSMNAETHARAFADQIYRVARGEGTDRDKHNTFYDEYLAVMDMPAEFYLSTVDRIFKSRDVARNAFTVDGKHVDITKIKDTAVKIVEGGRDDISAPGQCLAALDLLPNLPAAMKEQYLEPDAGHYGIFSGRAWRDNIRPAVLDFIDKHNKPRKPATRKKRKSAKVTQLHG
ncbi:MAG: polyhydroxyalkanoate depolymerase [Pseudomonadota bacterium]